MTLGQAIRKARGAESLEGFAYALSCTKTTLWRWEQDETIPRATIHRRQLIELGVPEELFVSAEVARRERRVAC